MSSAHLGLFFLSINQTMVFKFNTLQTGLWFLLVNLRLCVVLAQNSLGFDCVSVRLTSVWRTLVLFSTWPWLGSLDSSNLELDWELVLFTGRCRTQFELHACLFSHQFGECRTEWIILLHWCLWRYLILLATASTTSMMPKINKQARWVTAMLVSPDRKTLLWITISQFCLHSVEALEIRFSKVWNKLMARVIQVYM